MDPVVGRVTLRTLSGLRAGTREPHRAGFGGALYVGIYGVTPALVHWTLVLLPYQDRHEGSDRDGHLGPNTAPASGRESAIDSSGPG